MEKSAIQYMDTSSEVEIFFHLTKQKIFELGGNTAVTQNCRFFLKHLLAHFLSVSVKKEM